jgi:hypothetical protein
VVLDAQGRRQHGVSQLTSADLTGSRTQDGRGVNLPKSTYENPGPTPNLRGIEPNTSLDRAGNETEPEWIEYFPSEVPRGEVFNAPDDSGRLCVGESTLDNFDYSGRNSRPLVVPADSFTGIGESYPANGGLDGRS